MTPSRSAGEPVAYGPRDCAEESLAVMLTTEWMLRTGRRLGDRPLLHRLDAAALVEFWGW
ncbi:hypothetical protein EDD29_1798 [Actinocorallia herbida]|uniref:Uncharacterized protein n=1 Tax=Actinocorallia herbida TaxID=58109 RepID=A0A3N1CUB1_9ACTN|nr:hypothetical protein [Actinocorallia herbida]ROO84278.1 hypothetical protein EDD29_1798 [Actinocorallia herbida]